MKNKCLTFILCFFCLFSLGAQNSTIKVARIFSDHMVIQQGIYAPVWGWADPGSVVKIDFAGKSYETVTDFSGKWLIQTQPMQAGGPFRLIVKDGEEHEIKTFTNVMIGEVWLASGQSNMNFSLGGVADAKAVLAEADYPDIREFRTPNDVSRTPVKDLSGGEWTVCTPKTAADFSAVAYFFARSLYLDRKVPVGIIHTSWSGTICEAWISAEMLYTIPAFKNRVIQDIYKSDADWAELHAQGAEKDRMRGEIVKTSEAGLKLGAHKFRFEDRSWKSAAYPVYPSRVGLGGYKLIWLRREIYVPKEAAGKELELHLGKVIRSDVSYFNGQEIGRGEWDGMRTYRIPGKWVKAGKNVISVRLLSEWGNGRLGDEASDPYLYTPDKKWSTSLKGEWKYNGTIEPELPVGRGYSNEVTAMFNTKIAPIVPYGIKGFLWYQGEGNSGNPELYKQLQPTLITDWRVRFQQGYLPFLFVQLPNIDGGGWHYFREAQAASLDLPNVGMAVSLDVGNPYDIHPTNKRPVGERLYLRAKEVAYQDKGGIYQGPILESFRVDGPKVRIKFLSVGSGLFSKDGQPLRTFEVAGKDKKYQPAHAVIEGDEVVVWNEDVNEPVAVRHAWAPNPPVNLYNKEGIPATSFRTDTW